MSELVRLQKYLSQQGVCSRRQAEELIKAGKIKINDQVAILGIKINPAKDKVTLLNKNIKPKPTKFCYIALNKPCGYITSTTSKQGKSVLDLISTKDKQRFGHIYPVGRLDKDSQGLLLLTNDGQLANLLMHPRYEHSKEYQVTINKPLNSRDKQKLTTGMDIGGIKVKGIKIKNIKKSGQNYIATIILKEGKNRQIRKMFGSLGYNLICLKRTRINNLKLGNLKLGSYKLVKKRDIN